MNIENLVENEFISYGSTTCLLSGTHLGVGHDLFICFFTEFFKITNADIRELSVSQEMKSVTSFWKSHFTFQSDLNMKHKKNSFFVADCIHLTVKPTSQTLTFINDKDFIKIHMDKEYKTARLIKEWEDPYKNISCWYQSVNSMFNIIAMNHRLEYAKENASRRII
ncbi:hypothetical protein phiOC_p218 [Ochrobactrum phage vB_OspM_OC]|nr:hypothetical protein phiOC_p218 [Ochrobactrum phage vB_OspM_OC]